MKVRNAVFLASLIILFLTSAPALAAPPSDEIRIYAVGDETQMTFLTAAATLEADELVVQLQNPTGSEVKSFTLYGASYRHGKRLGGFGITAPATIYAHGFTNLRIAMRPEFLRDADVVLVSMQPLVTRGRSAPGHLLDVDETSSRLIGGVNLSAESQSKLKPIVNVPADGGCCSSCYMSAQGCGKRPLKSGGCTGICMTFYQCSYTMSPDGSFCMSVDCRFSCGDANTCC